MIAAARAREERRARRRGGACPQQVGERQGAHVALRRGGGKRDPRAGPLERTPQLGIGGAEAGGRAERDDQDVGARHGRAIVAVAAPLPPPGQREAGDRPPGAGGGGSGPGARGGGGGGGPGG